MHARLPAAIVVVLAMTNGCRGNMKATAGAPTPQPAMAAQLNMAFPTPPLFIMPHSLGFYVGIGALYDIVYDNANFYLYHGTTWYRAPSCKGPWTAVPYDGLPPLIRKQRIENIRKYRDLEYRAFLREKTHYRGSVLRPDR